MAQTKQAAASPSSTHLLTQPGGRRALATACLLALATSAHAAPPADCRGVNAGALDMQLEAKASATRSVILKAGDKLTFSFGAVSGPAGTIALLRATEPPRLLPSGPDGTQASFAAEADGTFAFRFSHDGADRAALAASCRSALAAVRGARERQGKRTGFAVEWGDADVALEEDALPVALAIDDPRGGYQPAPGIIIQEPLLRAPAKAGSAEMKLQWRDQRVNATGRDGPEVDGNASGVNIGVNVKVQPGIMVGALAQFEQPTQSLPGPPRSLLDQGWMVGPVANLKLAPGLSLEAQAAWGAAQAAADEFAAKSISAPRSMVSARLANVQTIGPWRLTPSLSVSHSQDTAVASPVLPGASPLPGGPEAVVPHAVGFGRVDVGPEMAYRIDVDGALFIEPKLAIGTFWGLDSPSKLAPGGMAHSEARLKAEAGVTIGATVGAKLQAAGAVEEGEAGAANVWSGRLQLSVPMQ